jgi:hypothetical protein
MATPSEDMFSGGVGEDLNAGEACMLILPSPSLPWSTCTRVCWVSHADIIPTFRQRRLEVVKKVS